MLFTVPNGDQFLSGTILDPETFYQGVLVPELFTSGGIVTGLEIYEYFEGRINRAYGLSDCDILW